MAKSRLFGNGLASINTLVVTPISVEGGVQKIVAGASVKLLPTGLCSVMSAEEAIIYYPYTVVVGNVDSSMDYIDNDHRVTIVLNCHTVMAATVTDDTTEVGALGVLIQDSNKNVFITPEEGFVNSVCLSVTDPDINANSNATVGIFNSPFTLSGTGFSGTIKNFRKIDTTISSGNSITISGGIPADSVPYIMVFLNGIYLLETSYSYNDSSDTLTITDLIWNPDQEADGITNSISLFIPLF
jgi:hypothetical protein